MTLTLALLLFNGWGTACAVPVGTPVAVHHPAPAFLPAPPPVPLVVPAPLDDAQVEAALKRLLPALVAQMVERRLMIELTKAEIQKAKADGCCVASCRCERCPEKGDCPCRDGAGRCGEGCACVVVGDKLPPTGVEWDKISPKDSYRDEKGPCSREDVVRKIESAAGDPSLTDDSAKPMLLVIGDEAFRKRALADLGSTPNAGLALVQAYAPDAEIPRERRYTPGVWLVKRDGTRLGTSPLSGEGYSKEALAGLLKWADPSYSPPPPPAVKGPAGLPSEVPLAYVVIGALALYFLLRKGS